MAEQLEPQVETASQVNKDVRFPIWATGRRKDSVARVRLSPGSGKIRINKKTMEDFFNGHERQKKDLFQPLLLTQTSKQFDILVNVQGGGVTGQSGAVRHAISRALAQFDEKLRILLRKEGYLTRDPRMVERKKPGQVKARKRFQFSKR
ncbi:MAG: 30S ribosomal protein S9 [Elusimicrobiota bacterium]